MSGLTYVDEFWKEPDRAVVTGVRSFSDGTEIAVVETTARLSELNWPERKALLSKMLARKAKEAGISAERHTSWSTRTVR